jgi:hypothetical protein
MFIRKIEAGSQKLPVSACLGNRHIFLEVDEIRTAFSRKIDCGTSLAVMTREGGK